MLNQEIKTLYSELVTLTELYLLREFSQQEKVMVDPSIYKDYCDFYRAKVALKKVNNPPVTVKPIQPSPAPLPKPSPAPIQKVVQQEVKESTQLDKDEIAPKASKHKLEKDVPSEQVEFNDFKKIAADLFPHLTILEKVPSDLEAQNLKMSWQTASAVTPLVILSLIQEEKQQLFLHHLAQAMSCQFGQTTVFSAASYEKEKRWDQLLNHPNLKFIIISETCFSKLSTLKQYYKQEGGLFLEKIPLLLLPDLSLYIKEPKLKPLLWQKIGAAVSRGK